MSLFKHFTGQVAYSGFLRLVPSMLQAACAYARVAITESVDSVCRDGTDMPYVAIHKSFFYCSISDEYKTNSSTKMNIQQVRPSRWNLALASLHQKRLAGVY